MSFKVKHGDVTIEGDFSRLNKLVKNLGKNYYVDVGILGEDATTQEGGKTVAGIGAEHEFGVKSRKPPLPERSFIRMPIETGQKQIEKSVGRRYQKHIENGDIKAIYTDIGLACEARILEAFETGGFGKWKELSEYTIQQKQSDAILIDTGTMMKSITSKPSEGTK